MCRIVGHQFDSNCFVVKLLLGNAPIIILQEVEDGRDKWRDFYDDMIAKGGKVFGVYSFDGFLVDGLFEQ